MTQPAHVPLLFGFRGIRLLQVVIVMAAGALAIAGVLMLKGFLDEDVPLMLILAVMFGILFIWLFGMAIRLPTSFVAISEDRMRIRYGGFVDQTVETRDVLGAQLVRWRWWQGIGVRTSFGGDVALVAATGPAAELTLRYPLRVWLIPRIWRVKATKVVVSVRNPHKMVERFGPVKNVPAPSANSKQKRRKGATR